MRENKYQAGLIKRIKERFNGCMVIKLDSGYLQGIPDLLVLYRDNWAALETKRSADASFRPNQQYYLDMMNEMSFAACIYPENEEAVLDELQQAFDSSWEARIP